MKHLYKDENGTIHECIGRRLISDDPESFVVFTLCGNIIGNNKSFMDDCYATCNDCMNIKNEFMDIDLTDQIQIQERF